MTGAVATVARAEAQVGIERVWVNELARVHLAARVEDGLELPEAVDEFLAVHADE